MVRRIAVTGATGFLGRRLVARLADRDGTEVVELGRRPSGPEAAFVEFDLASADPDRLSDVAADAVAHLAAFVPDDQSAGGMTRSEAVNGGGAVRLFEACRRAGVERLVCASSCHLRDPARPELVRNFYEGSKQSAERYLRVLSDHHGLSLLVLRLPYLYGPGMRHGRLFASLIRRARAGDRIQIHHGGLAQVRLLHVEDAVRAFLRGLGPAREVEGTYSVAPDRPTDVERVAATIVEALDSESEVVPVGDPMEAPPVPLLDPPVRATRADLGWEPRVPLRRGVAGLAADAPPGTPEEDP